MNSSDLELNDPVEFWEQLTVSEYSKRFNVPENTVRTRINRKKLKTTKGFRDGRESILILVEPDSLNNWNDSNDDYELSETAHGPFNEQPKYTSEQPPELLTFMERAFESVQNYSAQIIELSRQNERYKLISEHRTVTLEQLEQSNELLKTEIFERDAKIRELELRESKAPFLETRIQELETQIHQLKEELTTSKSDNNTLLQQLEAERKKTAIDKLFGR